MKKSNNNYFINKFEKKQKQELLDLIDNANCYQPEAVEAANWILKNKDFDAISQAESGPKEIKSIVVERAHFKSKLIFNSAVIILLAHTLLLILASFYRSSIYIYTWAAIYSVSLLVVISKHRKTAFYLRTLSAIALIVLLIQYILYFTTHYYYSFIDELFFLLKKDYKMIIMSLFIIFFTDTLIETRLEKINKT